MENEMATLGLEPLVGPQREDSNVIDTVDIPVEIGNNQIIIDTRRTGSAKSQYPVTDTNPGGLDSRRPFRALTGLRGLAAFCVFMIHTWPLPAPWAPDEPLWTWMGQAFFGLGDTVMVLFFQLSGFLMEHTTTHCRLDSWSCVKSFWWKRWARIYPMFILSLLFCIRDLRCFWQGDCVPHFTTLTLLTPLLLRGWYLPQLALLAPLWWNRPGWSLCVEAFCYLCFPLTSRLLRTLKARYGHCALWCVYVLLSLVSAVLTWTDTVHHWASNSALVEFPLARLPEFILGQVIRLLDVHPNVWWTPWPLLAMGLSRFTFRFTTHVHLLSSPISFLTGFWLMCLVQPNTRDSMAYVLALRPIVSFGEVSYPFYMFHFNMIEYLTILLYDDTVWQWRIPGSLVLPFVFLIVLFISIALHFLIENRLYRCLLQWKQWDHCRMSNIR